VLQDLPINGGVVLATCICDASFVIVVVTVTVTASVVVAAAVAADAAVAVLDSIVTELVHEGVLHCSKDLFTSAMNML
jgi:hypothetical protein